ncbi:hypothetical protein Tco_0383482 [Tanacetum coccineum]
MANKDLTRDEAREQWHAKTLAEKEFELVAKFDISDKSLMVNDGDKPVVIMEKDFKVILKNENNNPTKTQRGVRPTDFNKKLFLIKHESGKEVVCMKAVEAMGKLAMDSLVDGIRSYHNSKSGGNGGAIGWRQALAREKRMAHHSVVRAKASRLWLTTPLNSGAIPNLVPNSIFLTFFSMAQAYGTTTPILTGKKEMEEKDMNIDVDMGLYEGVQESMLEHEDKKIDEEMEIDEGVKVMHKIVGPFKICHNILKTSNCELLRTCFEDGNDSMRLVCVKDAEQFTISKGEFWKRLST